MVLLPSRGQLLLASLSLGMTLGCLEIAARVWLHHVATAEQYESYELINEVPPSKLVSTPHHYLNYIPTPNYRKGLTSHNSLGYRDREFALEKPLGTFRIVAIGGSTTYTAAVEDNDKTYPARLMEVLRAEYGHDQVEVINAGVGGYSSWESLVNLQFRVLDLEPDMVLVYLGTNDVHPRLVPPDHYRGDNSGRRRQWTMPGVALWDRSALLRIVRRRLGWSLEVGLSSLVDAPTAWYGRYFVPWVPESRRPLPDPRQLLESNPPRYFRRNLSNMVAVAREHHVELVLATWAHSPHLEDYASTEHYQQAFREGNRVVREVAHSHGAPLFDFAAAMPTEKRYWSDGRHLNEEGALLKARLFAEFLHRSGLLRLD